MTIPGNQAISLYGGRDADAIDAQQCRCYPILSLLHEARSFENLLHSSQLFTGLNESGDRIANVATSLLQIVSTRRYVQGHAVSDYHLPLLKVDDRDCLKLDTHGFILSTYPRACTRPNTRGLL